jgi:hypothetical protein
VPTALSEWTLPVIQQLLAAGCVEDGRFDWKEMFPVSKDVGGRDRIVRAATAMANAGGGFLVFGVRDKGDTVERIVGVPTDNEFGRELTQQLNRSDPPVPHLVGNPPLPVGPGRSIYVVEILGLSAPHAAADGYFYLRTGGGTDERLKTHQLRQLFRFDDVLEAPGLNDIRKVSFTFLRRSTWEGVRSGLQVLTAYAVEGTARQKVAVLEALTRLATHTRWGMPEDILLDMLSVSEEAVLDCPAWGSEIVADGVKLATEVAGHVAYDAALYLRHGFGLFTAARLLSQLLQQAIGLQRDDLRQRVLDQFEECINAARRAQPEPWLDAARWFEHKRDHPSRLDRVPPPELAEVEARLLGLRT